MRTHEVDRSGLKTETYLQGLEHARIRRHANQKVANNHGPARQARISRQDSAILKM